MKTLLEHDHNSSYLLGNLYLERLKSMFGISLEKIVFIYKTLPKNSTKNLFRYLVTICLLSVFFYCY
jgi:hypothetical protein